MQDKKETYQKVIEQRLGYMAEILGTGAMLTDAEAYLLHLAADDISTATDWLRAEIQKDRHLSPMGERSEETANIF
jgi:hypothetical protein